MSGINTVRYRLCTCKWPNCEEIRNSVIMTLPDNHVWCQEVIRIRFHNRDLNTMSTKQFALYNCIRRHILKEDEWTIVPSGVFLYPHHFPMSLLKWMAEKNTRTSLTQSMSDEEAQIVDKDHIGTQRFYDNSNTVHFFNLPTIHGFKKITRKECDKMYMK